MEGQCIREYEDYGYENQLCYPNKKDVREEKPQMPNKFHLHEQFVSIMEQMQISLIATFMLSQVLMYLGSYCKQQDSKRFQVKIQEAVGLVKNGILSLKELTSGLIEAILKVKEIKDCTFLNGNQNGFSNKQNQTQNKMATEYSQQKELQFTIKLSLIQKPTYQLFAEILQNQLQELTLESNYLISLSSIRVHNKCKQEQKPGVKNEQIINKENFMDYYFFEEQNMQCQICLMDIQQQFRAPLQGCNHAFHIECIKGYINSQIDSNIVEIKCPIERCKNYLTVNDLSVFLDNDTMEKYYRFTLNKYVENNDKCTSWCPTAGCSAVFQYDGVLDKYQCKVCKKKYCLSCRTECHKGLTCKENQSLGKQDTSFVRFAKGLKFKQCPKCKFWVQKKSGCVSIKCRCGIEFCYNCGGTKCPHGTCKELKKKF